MKTTSYTAYLNRLSGLVGIPASGFTADELFMIQGYFQTSIGKAWERGNWLDVCPYGEARFVGNLGTYPNDLTQSVWSSTAMTVTANAVANPCDGRVTASKLLETTANSAHSVKQSFTFIGSTQYQMTVYARPIGGRYLYLVANDGVTTYFAFFNILTGVYLTSGNLLGSPSIVQQNNGFYQCQINFTSNVNAGSGTFGVQSSSDGVTLSYAGNASDGLYIWGAIILQASFAAPQSLIVPWSQTGESTIDALFEAWKDSPAATSYPRPQGYELTPDGIQIVGTSGWNTGNWGYTPPQWYMGSNPVYLYYRQGIPDFTGSAYDNTAAYASGANTLFTNSNSIQNFFTTTAATVAGQSPDTNPSLWTISNIPDVFLKYCAYCSYADWLRMDGQNAKADGADANAESILELEFDRQERQMGWVQSTSYATHVTSQPRY